MCNFERILSNVCFMLIFFNGHWIRQFFILLDISNFLRSKFFLPANGNSEILYIKIYIKLSLREVKSEVELPC